MTYSEGLRLIGTTGARDRRWLLAGNDVKVDDTAGADVAHPVKMQRGETEMSARSLQAGGVKCAVEFRHRPIRVEIYLFLPGHAPAPDSTLEPYASRG